MTSAPAAFLVSWKNRLDIWDTQGILHCKTSIAGPAQAVKEGYGEELISGLKKLSKNNLADLAPSPLLVKLEYSHPTLSQRIDAIRAAQK